MMNGQLLPGNLDTLANLGKVQILRLSWSSMEVGEINSKDNKDLGWEKSEPAGITSPTISLVRVRELGSTYYTNTNTIFLASLLG